MLAPWVYVVQRNLHGQYSGMNMGIDIKSQAFLRAVYDAGGEAATTRIRDRTGLKGHERNYRFDKLAEQGFIEVSKKEPPYEGPNAPKVATLTRRGEEEVESGIDDEANEFLVENEVTSRVDELEERVELLERQSRNQDNRLARLEEWRDHIFSILKGSQ